MGARGDFGISVGFIADGSNKDVGDKVFIF